MITLKKNFVFDLQISVRRTFVTSSFILAFVVERTKSKASKSDIIYLTMPNSYRNPNVSYRKFSFYELNGYDIDFHKSDDSDSEKDNDHSDSEINEIDSIIQNPGTVRRKKSSGETAKITWKFKKLEADDNINICRSKCFWTLKIFHYVFKKFTLLKYFY